MAAGHPASIWAKTSTVAAEFPDLEGDHRTDVAVVGGGFTGLSVAQRLAERDVDTVVIEANDVGWGASGRNGGIAVPRFKPGFAALASRYGNEAALALHRNLLRALDDIAGNVERFAIPCDFAACGHLTPAHGKRALESLRADTAWLQREAGDRTPTILSAEETTRELGCSGYFGAYFDPRGCGLHPLDYARGLGRGLQDKGVRILTNAEVVAVRAGGGEGVVVETARGTVRADHAVIATNAYTSGRDGFGDLARRIVPVSTSVVATAPLSEAQLESVLPARRVVSDTKRIMHYYRLVRGNRLLFGGRGDITGRRDDREIYRPLEAAMQTFFPALTDTPIEARWSGRVAVTRDSLPHAGRLNERVVYAMGYGGRGVVLTHVLGRKLADMVLGSGSDSDPLGGGRFRPIPLHSFRLPGMQLAAAWYRLQDRMGR